jgi:hypothetical protein
MLEQMKLERQKMEMEAAQEAEQARIESRTMMCPECDTLGFVEENDYICTKCRNDVSGV